MFAEDAVVRESGLALVVGGDRHADRWAMTGTHDGELFGMAPTDSS